MKTTIDIPDDLFRLAKARASLSGISLRQFVTYRGRDLRTTARQRIQQGSPPRPLRRPAGQAASKRG